MSQKRNSPDNEGSKHNARLNIIQAIGTAYTSSPPTTPSQPSQPSHHLPEVGVVDNVQPSQSDSNISPSLQPPSAKPRSPRQSHSSPIRQKDIDGSTALKPLPQRPPPPKLIPRKNTSRSDFDLQPEDSMRSHSTDMDIQKPKPPVRTRKKKFASVEEVRQPPRQSEFVELSTSDIIVDCNDGGEVRVVSDGVMDRSKNALQKLEEVKEEGEGETLAGNSGVDLYRDDWEVIPDSAANQAEMSRDESCLHPHGDTSKIENAIKSMSLKKKRRPPPFRPPPYNPGVKTPPIPPKKRKTVSIQDISQPVNWNQLAEEVSTAVVKQNSEREQDETNAPENLVSRNNGDHDHVYEAIDHAVEVSDNSDPESANLNLLSRPENVIKHGSLSSVDSDQSEGGGNKSDIIIRSGTVSEGLHRDKKNLSISSRPKSEFSPSVAHKELEASFEVIPQMGSDLDTVMSSLRQTDERYQDASVYDLIQACSKALPHITSTSELPSRLPDFPDTSRALVIHELYTTEYTYVKGLEVLCEVFRDALSPIIGEETSHVFANVDDILSFNKSFLALLHSRLRELGPDARIGDLIIGMFTQAHKSMYAIYCSNYDSAEMHVSRMRKRKELEQTLVNCFSNNRVMPGLTLTAYLITPVQRIPRYILLLKDVIKHTPDGHPDKKSLIKAKEIMGELANFIDAQVRESQTKKTFDALKNKVHGLADLDSPDRHLVKEGQVYFKNIKKLYQCILFNDLLVFAHGDSKQSKVELQLDLEAVWFQDLVDLDPQTSEEDAIEIYTPERPYTFYARSRAEKRLWLNKLRDTVYHYLLKKEKCERSQLCSTESRHASFVYSNGRVYNGHFIDSRRHGKGTMTWPNKTVYLGDWADDERCGEGELTYNTGEVYRGRWSEDKQNGYGELQFASNDVYRGNWKDGIRNGSGKILYSNGDKFEGHFSSGQIEGKGKLTCVNGVMYDGDWKHSQRHGKGKLKTSTKKNYEGDFLYNQIHGLGTMIYENKDVYIGRWKNGMRNGNGKFTSKLEGNYEGSWEDDARHGAGKLTYPNGDVYEGGWELNKKHKKGKLTYSTGKIYEGDFCYEVIHGEGEMKYSSTCKYQGSWVNSLRHGSGAMVFPDNSSYNGSWELGLRHGQGEVVMADGSVYRGMWSNGVPNGKGTLFIPYTNYKYNGDWVNGKREGRGEEISQYGQYKGGWRGDVKHGYGEERSLVGTIFEGTWEKGRKNGRGVRKMIFGAVYEQTWKGGQLMSDTDRMTAAELPFISRNDT